MFVIRDERRKMPAQECVRVRTLGHLSTFPTDEVAERADERRRQEAPVDEGIEWHETPRAVGCEGAGPTRWQLLLLEAREPRRRSIGGLEHDIRLNPAATVHRATATRRACGTACSV